MREVLHRSLYRGEIVWNRTKKRDAWGQKRRSDRPEADWVSVSVESLRIVPEALWRAAHVRMTERRENYQRWKCGEGGAPDGRGVRTRYFLTGFGRCDVCGGSMQAVSRASSVGRNFRYVCATYWNRGASICPNGRMVNMPVADGAVQQLLATEVLRPAVVDHALMRAVELLRADADGSGRRQALTRDLAAVEAELRNLAETAAKGGAVPVIFEALEHREADRRRLQKELSACAVEHPATCTPAHVLRAQLRGFLDDWQGLLSRNVAEARPLLDLVLADRIGFTPTADRCYQLTVPIVFDCVLRAAVPDLRGLQDRVASPSTPSWNQIMVWLREMARLRESGRCIRAWEPVSNLRSTMAAVEIPGGTGTLRRSASGLDLPGTCTFHRRTAHESGDCHQSRRVNGAGQVCGHQ